MSEASPTLATQMFIDGKWVESVGGEFDEIINPATGKVITSVPRGTAADVDLAVEAASRALPEWLETTPTERMYLLNRMADIADENAELLGRIESENTGKPLIQAIYQVGMATDTLRYMASAVRNLEGLSAGQYVRGYESYVRREPIGIAAGIAPWNYPLPMAAWKFAPALAAGNVHILKPSELTPLSVLKFVELTQEVLPPGVLQIVTGDGPSVGQRLVEHPEVSFVSLTGDVATGRKVASQAGAGLKRSHMELGGNHPVIIFDDADLAYVKSTLKYMSYFNSGQDCELPGRILVAPNLYDAVVADMVDIAESLRIGDPAKSLDIELGSLISKRQQARVLGFLERAEADGAQILTGGKTLNEEGAFVTPAVVVGVTQDSEIVQSEVFGPVVTIQRFESDDQAIDWANDTRRRLAATVFTENHTRAIDATRRLKFGKVWVNDTLSSSGELPHGGFADSGYGKDGSKYSFEEYTQIKLVTHRARRERSWASDEMLSDWAAIKASLEDK